MNNFLPLLFLTICVCSFIFVNVKNVQVLLVWKVAASKMLKSLHPHNGIEIMQQSRKDSTLRLVEASKEDGQLGRIMEINGYRWLLQAATPN